jgi:hypothetical protein
MSHRDQLNASRLWVLVRIALAEADPSEPRQGPSISNYIYRTSNRQSSNSLGVETTTTTAAPIAHNGRRQDVRIARGNLLCFRMKIRFDLRKYHALEIVSEYPADCGSKDGQ